MDRTFSTVSRLRGSVRVPADKSLTHRALIFAAMCAGDSSIGGPVAGQDVGSTMECLRTLGAGFDRDGDRILVSGTGWKTPAEAELYAGNSGTTMRLLAGALAGRPGRYRLSGDESLSRRPMGRVAIPLRLMGAAVELAEGALPPMVVQGGALTGISYTPEVASAQVKGAILLAGLQADGVTTITEAQPTRDHTERFLRWLGARVEVDTGSISVGRSDELFQRDGFEFDVPGDLSSAAFLLVAALLCADSEVRVDAVGLNPGRTGILEILKSMGAQLDISVESDSVEPAGSAVARSSSLKGVEVSGDLVPRTIDELPVLALAATQAEGTTVIRDAGDLRAKESDRIAVLARNLTALGASIEEMPDGLVIVGPTRLHGGVVEAAGDHRMAMTFALAGLIATDPVTVRGWESAAVSYPGFETDLARIGS